MGLCAVCSKYCKYLTSLDHLFFIFLNGRPCGALVELYQFKKSPIWSSGPRSSPITLSDYSYPAEEWKQLTKERLSICVNNPSILRRLYQEDNYQRVSQVLLYHHPRILYWNTNPHCRDSPEFWSIVSHQRSRLLSGREWDMSSSGWFDDSNIVILCIIIRWRLTRWERSIVIAIVIVGFHFWDIPFQKTRRIKCRIRPCCRYSATVNRDIREYGEVSYIYTRKVLQYTTRY